MQGGGGDGHEKPCSRYALSVHFKNHLMVKIIILMVGSSKQITSQTNSHQQTKSLNHMLNLARVNSLYLVDTARMFFVTHMVGISVLEVLRMRTLNTKSASTSRRGARAPYLTIYPEISAW